MKKFPREIGFPNRVVCETEQDFWDKFNKYNHIKKRLYFNLYDTNHSIDKASFDLDNENRLINVRKLHQWGLKNNYKHLLIFSTKGFWVHFFTINYTYLKYKKDALYNLQLDILKQAEIEKSEIDNHILGDIERLSRLPLGYDCGRQRYCIPLTTQDLELGYDHICEKSKTPITKMVYYGRDLINIGKFDYASEIHQSCGEIPDLDIDVKLEHKSDMFLPCVRCWLLDMPHPTRKHDMGTWQGRFYFAVYCKEICMGKPICLKLAQEHYSKVSRTDHFKNNFNHFKRVKVVDYAYLPRTTFPNCDTLWELGLCPGKCKNYKQNGSPLYK